MNNTGKVLSSFNYKLRSGGKILKKIRKIMGSRIENAEEIVKGNLNVLNIRNNDMLLNPSSNNCNVGVV